MLSFTYIVTKPIQFKAQAETSCVTSVAENVAYTVRAAVN